MSGGDPDGAPLSVASSPANGETRSRNIIDRVLLIATCVFLLVGVGGLAWKRIHSPPALTPTNYAPLGSPERFTRLDGRDLSRLAITEPRGSRALGKRSIPVIVYVFLTTCHYCGAQREHIAALLATVDRSDVMSASIESLAVTARYWSGLDRAPAAPVQLSPEASEELLLPGTPTLIFLRADGRVAAAYVGTSMSWNADTLRRQLVAARGEAFAASAMRQ